MTAPRLIYHGELDDPEDRQSIADVDREVFGASEPTPGWEAHHWWTVEHEGVVMAYASICPSMRYLDTAYLARAGVVREYRGHGLQRRLIQVRVRWARRHGYAHVCTDVANWNVASANNLIRCGFRLFRPRHPWSFADALYLTKSLETRSENACFAGV